VAFGLGSAVAKRIVALPGGQISITSAVDAGATQCNLPVRAVARGCPMSTRIPGVDDETDAGAVPREPSATANRWHSVPRTARACAGPLPMAIPRPIRNNDPLAPIVAGSPRVARGDEALARGVGSDDHAPWPFSSCAPLAGAHHYLPIGKSSCAAHR
jgi:hypothetical protein